MIYLKIKSILAAAGNKSVTEEDVEWCVPEM